MVIKVFAERAHNRNYLQNLPAIYFVAAKVANLIGPRRNIWFFGESEHLLRENNINPDDGDLLICRDGILQVTNRTDGKWKALQFYYLKLWRKSLPALLNTVEIETRAKAWMAENRNPKLPLTIWLSPEWSQCVDDRFNLFLTKATNRQLAGKNIHFAHAIGKHQLIMKSQNGILTQQGQLWEVTSHGTLTKIRPRFTFPPHATLR